MENISEFRKKHFTGIGEERSLMIKYDNEPLLVGTDTNSETLNWYYIKENDKQILNIQLKRFDMKFFDVFLDDIAEQLMNGINRNNLEMNIPHEITRVKIGDKIIEI